MCWPAWARGFTPYVGMLSAPLVIPEVKGISLLLMFVELRGHLAGLPRTACSPSVGHVTLCMAFVAVVIQTRIRDLTARWKRPRWTRATPLVVFFSRSRCR